MRDSVTRAFWIALGVFAVVVAIGVVVTVVVGLTEPADDTLSLELGKAALQLLVLALAGGVIGGATFYFQQSFLDDKDRQARAEKDRRLQDTRIRLMLDEVITAYHRLKKQRRIMRARASEGVTLKRYDDFADRMIDIQLTFEQLWRLARQIDGLGRLHVPDPREIVGEKVRPEWDSLSTSLDEIQKYVQDIVTEFEEKRYILAAAPGTPAPYSDFPNLDKLCARAHQSDFPEGLSYHVDMVVDVLHGALLAPTPTRTA